MAKYLTDQIRNVAIMGHGGSGKTTLTEALLHKTGVINRMGRVEDGSTVADWDAEEQRRGISINLSVIPIEFEETKINLIDTPGYMDFVGEVISALHVSEAGLMLVDAVAGVEVGTELAWDRLDELGKPRLVFVNRMGRENANFARTIENLQSSFPESNIVPFQLPVGQGENFNGVISLVTGKAYLGSEGKTADVPADMVDAVEAAQVTMIEAAAEADDDLIEKYFEGEELTPEEVRRGLHKGVRSGAIVPVYCGSALGDIGLERVLKALRRYVPAPNEHAIAATQGDESIELRSDASGPVAGAVFKTIIDRYVGRMNYIRVFSGTIHKDDNLVNSRTGESYRIANLFNVRGKDLENTDALVAGDIGVATKLDGLLTKDTLTTADAKIAVASAVYPRPLYSVAVSPATKADSAKMGQSLQAITEEDPTLQVQNIATTKQNVLQGMGDAHVDVSIRRLESKFGVKVDTSVPKVPYQETATREGKARYRHKKQTGGAGQLGMLLPA